MIQKFWIDGKLPSLNEYINACSSHAQVGGKFKKRWKEYVCLQIRQCRLSPVIQARFDFVWVEKDKTRDKDNISSIGRKIIFDALVHEGILKNDGWRQVVNWTDHFYVSSKRPVKEPGVFVVMDDLLDLNLPSKKFGSEGILDINEFY